jgi:hypothetical protein
MLHANLSRDANLFRAGAKQLGQTGGCHGAGDADFTLMTLASPL